MKRSKRYLWIALLAIALPVAYIWFELWNNFERPVVWDSWHVALPQGGAVEYRNQSPRMRWFGPADTTKLLIWTKPDNRTREYLIGMSGGSYRDLEVRIRDDEKGIWLIALDSRAIVATLDLKTGRCTGQWGIDYDNIDVVQNDTPSDPPKWATMKGGRSLGRKKLQ